MDIKFNKIVNGNIFCDEFINLTKNNQIIFNTNRFSIIYGPNGTGKTSLAKVLNQEKGSEYSISIDGKTCTENEPKFAHVISDQNDRNIIQGSTEDFILGDNIKREYELKGKIEAGFKNLFEAILIPTLKKNFGISVKKSSFDTLFTDKKLLQFVSDLANVRSKGKLIDREDFLAHLQKLTIQEIPEHDENKFIFFVEDYKKNDSAIKVFLGQIFSLDAEEKALLKLDENDEAVRILEKFNYLNECIICDHEIDRDKILCSKQVQKIAALESLSEKTKKIIEGIIQKLPFEDPFGITESLKSSLRYNNPDLINDMKKEIALYLDLFPSLINNYFVVIAKDSSIFDDFKEYSGLIKEKPQFENEDILFIERFLNDCLDRKITLTRDKDNNLRMLLGDEEFLNRQRKYLLLSNGEQNFLSLAFELLKSQKVSQDIIVLDDPISSFDSIYKNKIAFSILKLLSDKRAVILTHSTELIKLLEHQSQGCFNLYYLNNTNGEENGLININKNEIEILLYIHKFIDLLRTDIKDEIIDELTFLISVVPFLRGCCHIFNRPEERDLLSKLMHGYETETINLTKIYNSIIGPGVIKNQHIVAAQDILKLKIDNPEPISPIKYPLLHKTMTHTFTYLFLRLNVENVLVSKYKIDTSKHYMLTHIISNAFKGSEPEAISNRVFFMSRKTLLNEFNHFEIDMNIFQPAIDITNQALIKEKEQIMKKLVEL
jgi:energy-coupling factor transporter ATP-binding protein EcfA2/predicted nucleic acid-binding Zn ribbon protein